MTAGPGDITAPKHEGSDKVQETNLSPVRAVKHEGPPQQIPSGRQLQGRAHEADRLIDASPEGKRANQRGTKSSYDKGNLGSVSKPKYDDREQTRGKQDKQRSAHAASPSDRLPVSANRTR